MAHWEASKPLACLLYLIAILGQNNCHRFSEWEWAIFPRCRTGQMLAIPTDENSCEVSIEQLCCVHELAKAQKCSDDHGSCRDVGADPFCWLSLPSGNASHAQIEHRRL